MLAVRFLVPRSSICCVFLFCSVTLCYFTDVVSLPFMGILAAEVCKVFLRFLHFLCFIFLVPFSFSCSCSFSLFVSCSLFNVYGSWLLVLLQELGTVKLTGRCGTSSVCVRGLETLTCEGSRGSPFVWVERSRVLVGTSGMHLQKKID